MKTILFAACCAAMAWPVAAADPADPADPAAAVPRMAYRSVFQDTPTGVEGEALDWRKANAEVARFPRGHIDLLKWEEAQPAAVPGSARTPATAPATAPAHQH